jgi:hypothetical protein
MGSAGREGNGEGETLWDARVWRCCSQTPSNCRLSDSFTIPIVRGHIYAVQFSLGKERNIA